MKTMSLETFMAFHGLLLIVLTICVHALNHWLPIFAWFNFWLILLVVWPMLMLSALFYIPLRFKARGWNVLRPISYGILTVVVMRSVVDSHLPNRLEFAVKRRGFERVVQMVERGELKPNRKERILLPAELRRLSNIEDVSAELHYGEIIANKYKGRWTIFFATEGGYEVVKGFAYRTNDFEPTGLEFYGATRFQPAKDWFYYNLIFP